MKLLFKNLCVSVLCSHGADEATRLAAQSVCAEPARWSGGGSGGGCGEGCGGGSGGSGGGGGAESACQPGLLVLRMFCDSFLLSCVLFRSDLKVTAQLFLQGLTRRTISGNSGL